MITQTQQRWIDVFFKPVPGHSVAVMRIAMGALMLFESINYGVFHCLDCRFRGTAYLFKYQHFEWAVLPPGRGLEALFLVMGVSAIGVMLGYRYRLSILVLTASVAWYFLLDATEYLNHYYLALLFLSILCVIPANRVWSMDAKKYPCSPYIGNWSRIWLIVQLEIVLIWAGLVKLNPDWLQLEPLRLWMTSYSADAGPLMQWITQDPGIAFGAYGAIALHLIGAPLLLFKKTRFPVFCVYLFFHMVNATVFNIGIFPFMTAAATTLIFEPDWPVNLLARFRRGMATSRERCESALIRYTEERRARNLMNPLIITFVIAWLVVQALLPTRPLWHEGPVVWNEAGHKFSWRMKLRDKRGRIRFLVRNNLQKSLRVVEPGDYLTRRQVRKMSCQPDLIWQFAQFLEAKELEAANNVGAGKDNISVTASALCSLNTRKAVPLIKAVDLTTLDQSTPRDQWVTPFTEPL